MNIMNKIVSLMVINWHKFTQACSEVQQFQERIWIVSIQQSSGQQSSMLNDTFLVSEDSFDRPMQWMELQGYQAAMIKNVDKMRCSQAIKIQLENSLHSLIRVK
ncbi:hypothetical protein [Psychromonas aquimarina]|uniref:hypothetical protein n=1 Tax=Psychromonas aquimarina TaxID=444919 RepID=UPI000400E08F|nr:hypothetical protein [Psychromonas aquimarina]